MLLPLLMIVSQMIRQICFFLLLLFGLLFLLTVDLFILNNCSCFYSYIHVVALRCKLLLWINQIRHEIVLIQLIPKQHRQCAV